MRLFPILSTLTVAGRPVLSVSRPARRTIRYPYGSNILADFARWARLGWRVASIANEPDGHRVWYVRVKSSRAPHKHRRPRA